MMVLLLGRHSLVSMEKSIEDCEPAATINLFSIEKLTGNGGVDILKLQMLGAKSEVYSNKI